MTHKQSINNYLMYMWNHWDYKTCIEIFDKILGQHIWEKWINICEDYGSTGGVAVLWSKLDGECQQKLATVANNYYEPVKWDL